MRRAAPAAWAAIPALVRSGEVTGSPRTAPSAVYSRPSLSLVRRLEYSPCGVICIQSRAKRFDGKLRAVKAALMSKYGRPLELVERDTPELTRPDHVLVRVGGAGVCATDLHAIDDFVQNFAVGDLVIVYPPYSCGLCVPCRRATDMHCVNHDFTGLSVDGGFADYVLVTERSLIKLPEGVEPAQVAPHADAGITAMHAVKRIAHLAGPGTTVAVIGVGGVGHIAVQLLHELGNGRVLAIDTDERRRELARWVGADEVLEGGDGVVSTVRDATDGHGADVVIDFV